MSRFRGARLGAVLLVLTVVAYLPVWRNDFIDYDDEVYITGNDVVTGGLSWPAFR
jgi:hypothetical protein